jgi:glycerate 2-kinase
MPWRYGMTSNTGMHDARVAGAPRVICLGHALKETLAVGAARDAMTAGVLQGGGIVAGAFCISDGGDGFLDAYAEMRPTVSRVVECTGPLGDPVAARMLLDAATGVALVETAQACGIALVDPARRDIMNSGTAGVGDLIAEAVQLGARRVMVGLGGSATCDGGVGFLHRLGARLLYGDTGAHLAAADLARLPDVRIRKLRSELEGIEIVVCTDVTNPLLGPLGTAAKYGPQKGATPGQVGELDALLARWADMIESELGFPLRDQPGAGAAGGLGYAFAALGGAIVPGAEALLDLLGFRDRLGECDAVVTCEGRFDMTSLHGKAPWSAAVAARQADKGALVACGICDPYAVALAAEQGIVVRAFAEGVPVDRRAPEAAPRLKQCVAEFVAGTDCTPPQTE